MFEDALVELKYWIKVEEGVTKNNQRSFDSDVADRGFLPYWKFFPGVNPGLMFEEHLSRLSPGSVFLFNKPRHLGVTLHDPSVTILYENSKVGKHTIARMVPTISKLAKSDEHFTNHDLRATGLCSLKKAGKFDFEEIKKVSGHKSTKSIEENYHVGLETKKKSDMMFAILNAAKLGRGEDFEPISNHLEKRNKAPSSHSAFSAMKVACPLASGSEKPSQVKLRQVR